MNEEGNGSLLEIVIAAMILVGSMALVNTMEPTITALEPAKSEDGYIDSVMDAFELTGVDAAALAVDLWVDGVDDGGSPIGTDWLNSTIGADYSIFVNTGYDRVLVYGIEKNGPTSGIAYVLHATDPELLFGSDGTFMPGEVRYFDDLLGDLVPVLGSSQEVTAVTHLEPLIQLPTSVAVPSGYSRAADGDLWREHWDTSIQAGNIPTKLPYGMWEVTVKYCVTLCPPFAKIPETFEWLVLPSRGAMAPQYAMYTLELVI